MIISKHDKDIYKNRQVKDDSDQGHLQDHNPDEFRRLMEVSEDEQLTDEQSRHLIYQYIKDCIKEISLSRKVEDDASHLLGNIHPNHFKWLIHNGPLAGCVIDATWYLDSLTLEIIAPDEKVSWLSKQLPWIIDKLSTKVGKIDIKKKTRNEDW